MDRRLRRTIAMIMIAGLLIPTGYGMIRGNFLLAGICTVGIIAARIMGISKTDVDE